MATPLRKSAGITNVMAGCYDCKPDGYYIWHSRNAVAVAANHARATGHFTWAEQVMQIHYNERERDL